jgi:diaminopimelate decarboxylase
VILTKAKLNVEGVTQMSFEKPCFVIDNDAVKAEILKLQSYGYHVVFPVKTLPNRAFLKSLRRTFDGFDITNLSELELLPQIERGRARLCAFSPVTADILALSKRLKAAAPKSVIAVQTAQQLAHRAKFHRYCLRLNPYSLVQAPNHHVSRFGFSGQSFDRLPNRLFKERRLVGISTHFGLGLLDRDIAIQFLLELKKRLTEREYEPEVLNLGGGSSRLTDHDMQFVFQVARDLFPSAEIWIEPGERVTQAAITLETEVLDVFENEGAIFCQLDISVEANLRWTRARVSTEFLTSEWPNFDERASGSPLTSSSATQVWFVGSTCSEADRWGPYYLKKSIRANSLIGRKILFHNIAGYALAWNRDFNGQHKLAIQLRSTNKRRMSQKIIG